MAPVSLLCDPQLSSLLVTRTRLVISRGILGRVFCESRSIDEPEGLTSVINVDVEENLLATLTREIVGKLNCFIMKPSLGGMVRETSTEASIVSIISENLQINSLDRSKRPNGDQVVGALGAFVSSKGS